MFRFLALFIFATFPILGATWYIRPDGGTATQCTGKTDAAYSGSGANQPCAFKNPFYLWTNDPPQTQAYENPKWKIAGGDTVLIKNGDYRMGFKSPDANGWWNYLGCRGNNHGCYNPPIPAGTSAAPTRIVGEAWQSGCATKPILRGAGGTQAVINLKGTNHVDVECIEITDAAQCRIATITGEPYACVNYQSDDGYWGLLTDQDTSYLTLRNLFIHGMSNVGIIGNIGGNVVADNLYLRGNGNMGWDFDPGGGAPSVGPLTITNSVIEWSACVERYPLASPVILQCYDQAGANANGDGLGFVDLKGDITIDHTIVRYNQQDGLDALYVKSGANLTVTNSQFYGNNGQQVKTGGSTHTTIRNNLITGDCARQQAAVTGVTAANFNQYEKSWCRGEDMVALMYRAGTNLAFENNTLVTYSPTAFDMQCRAAEDIFNGSGRTAATGAVTASLATNGSRRDFPTLYPIQSIMMGGGVYVYPQTGSRVAQLVGRAGTDVNCNGSPCQFWYKPGTTEFYQDPAQPPLKATDELRVDYSSASYCTGVTTSFKNNMVRAYNRISLGSAPGAFYINNLPSTPSASQFMNNIYCGFRPFVSQSSEKQMAVCPDTFFTSEVAALLAEVDIDKLDLYPGPNSPAIDGGVTIPGLTVDINGNPRPHGAAYDVGAYEVTPGAGGVTTPTSPTTPTTPTTPTSPGTTAAPKVALSAATVTFGSFRVGTAAPAQIVTLTNSGSAALTIGGVSVTGTNVSDFSAATNCITSVAAGASCKISLGFKPTAAGTRKAVLSIATGAGTSTVALTGTGTVAASTTAGQFALSAAQLSFGTIAIGKTATMTLTARNAGGSAVKVSSVVISGANASDFSQTNTCLAGLAAGGSCTISVTFKPTALYGRAGLVTITDNAPGSPHKAILVGSGSGVPTAVLSATALAFGIQKVGTASAWKSVTLTNSGTGTLVLTSYTLSGTNAADFLLNRTCSSALAASASCTVSVQFKPAAAGSRSALLTLADNAATLTQKITLTGTAQ